MFATTNGTNGNNSERNGNSAGECGPFVDYFMFDKSALMTAKQDRRKDDKNEEKERG